MSRLGFLDQAMFKLEEGGMSPMHMCGAMILDTSGSPVPVDGDTVADHIAACMEEIPLMRQRLIQDPVKLGDLRLLEDPHFDVNNHVTRSSIDSPGGYDELTGALGDFSTRRMNLAGPLWLCEVIDGLDDGRIAIAIRIHHAVMDGTGGQRVLGSIWSPEPLQGRKPRPEAWEADAIPTPLSLLTGALLETGQRLYIRTPSFILNNFGPILQTLKKQISKKIDALEQREQTAGRKPLKVQKTSLNVAPISGQRVVSYLELPLDEVKALRRHFDCSINDLALLFGSCALEHYFSAIGEVIDFDLVAGMPVDMRSEGDVSAGNSLALTRVNLKNTVSDIQKRLQAIVEQTSAIKTSTKPDVSPGESMPGIDYQALSGLFSPLTLDVMTYGIVRFNLMDKATFINVAIANVPGSQAPMYLAGAKLHSQIPMGPCTDSLALNITVSSTDEYLVVGYHGCGETIQDKELLVEGARNSFDSLKKASRPRRSPTAKKVRPKRKAKSAAKRKAKTSARLKSKKV